MSLPDSLACGNAVLRAWTKTLKVTPAMEAGLTDRLWPMTDIVAMLAC
jgi:hypothetical protein